MIEANVSFRITESWKVHRHHPVSGFSQGAEIVPETVGRAAKAVNQKNLALDGCIHRLEFSIMQGDIFICKIFTLKIGCLDRFFWRL